MTKVRTGRSVDASWRANARRLGFCYMGIFLLILFFKNSDAAALWVTEGLRLCVTRLIPSLFPFMVVSSLIVSSGAGAYVCKPIGGISGKLLGTRADGACAVILGWLCGFPVGAKCAGELYDNGRIDREEYNRIVCVSSTPSPAFLIGAVGKGMLGSAAYGVILYGASLISAVAVGVIFKLVSKNKEKSVTASCTDEPKRGMAEIITGAITDSGFGMVSVCAFVVFFSAFLGVMNGALSGFSLPDGVVASIFFIFELTTGVSKIATLDAPYILPLAALAVGWSGLSVHFQTISICAGRGVRLLPYFLAHALRAVICFALVSVTEWIVLML